MHPVAGKILSFTDLIAWQRAHMLVLEIYSCSSTFPKSEMFSLTNQMRRAAVSITSNIAEGFSRYSKAEKRQFYYFSIGSLTELHNQCILSCDLSYIDRERYRLNDQQIQEVSKLNHSLIKNVT